MINTTK